MLIDAFGDVMSVVLSVGGSLLIKDGKVDVGYILNLSALIKKSKQVVGVVVGGGSIARAYANAIRKFGGSEFEADEIAILATRMNAYLLMRCLKDVACVCIPKYFDEVCGKRTVIMGGTIPGITTDADGVLLAERLGAKRIVNLSNVSGIYDKDPSTYKDAKKFDTMTKEQLLSLAYKYDKRTAGSHFVFDLVACKLLARSDMEAHFVNGKDLDGVKRAIEGKKHEGTVVK